MVRSYSVRASGILVLIALMGCSRATDELLSVAPVPVAVRVVAARRGSIESTLAASGETAALRTVRLASPVAGRIAALSVQPGDHLGAGSTAARVLPLENEAAVHGFDILSRAGALSASDSLVAQRLARTVAGHDIALAAPFDSMVAERLHNPGEQVAANDVLLELYDPRSLVVIAQIPIDAARDIHPDQPVDVQLSSRHIHGYVDALQTAVTPQSLTIPVRVRLSEPLQPPLLHAAVQCRILVAQHVDVVLIPRSALVSSSIADDAHVMVAVGERAEQRPVRLGLRSADHVEVTEGLAAGEWVLSEGGFALPENAAIAPLAVAD